MGEEDSPSPWHRPGEGQWCRSGAIPPAGSVNLEEDPMRAALLRTAGGVAVVGALAVFRPGTRANRALRRRVEATGRRARRLNGRLRGVRYRLGGGHPDPDVADPVLADRVRSVLGPAQKRLDIPHVHVMVHDRVVRLDGDVAYTAQAEQIERVAAGVSGVGRVDSHLHVGLLSGDARPSEGRSIAGRESQALRRLVDTAVDAGAEPSAARPAVAAVLATFAELIPRTERGHVAAHLPADVRTMLAPPPRRGPELPPRTATELFGRVEAMVEALAAGSAERVTRAVLAQLRGLVPEEAADVAAVLPAELRPLWDAAGVR